MGNNPSSVSSVFLLHLNEASSSLSALKRSRNQIVSEDSSDNFKPARPCPTVNVTANKKIQPLHPTQTTPARPLKHSATFHIFDRKSSNNYTRGSHQGHLPTKSTYEKMFQRFGSKKFGSRRDSSADNLLASSSSIAGGTNAAFGRNSALAASVSDLPPPSGSSAKFGGRRSASIMIPPNPRSAAAKQQQKYAARKASSTVFTEKQKPAKDDDDEDDHEDLLDAFHAEIQKAKELDKDLLAANRRRRSVFVFPFGGSAGASPKHSDKSRGKTDNKRLLSNDKNNNDGRDIAHANSSSNLGSVVNYDQSQCLRNSTAPTHDLMTGSCFGRLSSAPNECNLRPPSPKIKERRPTKSSLNLSMLSGLRKSFTTLENNESNNNNKTSSSSRGSPPLKANNSLFLSVNAGGEFDSLPPLGPGMKRSSSDLPPPRSQPTPSPNNTISSASSTASATAASGPSTGGSKFIIGEDAEASQLSRHPSALSEGQAYNFKEMRSSFKTKKCNSSASVQFRDLPEDSDDSHSDPRIVISESPGQSCPAIDEGKLKVEKEKICVMRLTSDSVNRLSAEQIAVPKPQKQQRSQSTTKAKLATNLLTLAQISMLRQIWNQLMTSKGPSYIGTMIFQRLFFKDSKIKEVFAGAKLGDKYRNVDMLHKCHAKAVTDCIDNVIQNLEQLEALGPILSELGRTHGTLYDTGLMPKFWETFAEAFVDCTLQWGEKNRRTDEARKAWIIVISFIVDKIKQGFQDERKLATRRKASTSQLD